MQGERETKLNIFGEPGENPIYNSILHQGTVFKIIPKFKAVIRIEWSTASKIYSRRKKFFLPDNKPGTGISLQLAENFPFQSKIL